MAKVCNNNPIDMYEYFTVEMGVGKGRANNIDDVLMQYLLNLWLQRPTNGGARIIYTILGLNTEVRKLYIRENGSMIDLVERRDFPSKLWPMIARYTVAQNFR